MTALTLCDSTFWAYGVVVTLYLRYDRRLGLFSSSSPRVCIEVAKNMYTSIVYSGSSDFKASASPIAERKVRDKFQKETK